MDILIDNQILYICDEKVFIKKIKLLGSVEKHSDQSY